MLRFVVGISTVHSVVSVLRFYFGASRVGSYCVDSISRTYGYKSSFKCFVLISE